MSELSFSTQNITKKARSNNFISVIIKEYKRRMKQILIAAVFLILLGVLTLIATLAVKSAQNNATNGENIEPVVPAPPIYPKYADEWILNKSGLMTVIDISSCFQTDTASCFGQNPTSPYTITNFYVNRNLPVNPLTQLGVFRLQTNQVLLITGFSPPPCLYWGFTMYLFNDRNVCDGEPLFASVADTVNSFNTQVPPNHRWGMVVGSNSFIVKKFEAALFTDVDRVQYLYPKQSPTANMCMLGRTALFANPEDEKRYYEYTGLVCYILTYYAEAPAEFDVLYPTWKPRVPYLDEHVEQPGLPAFEAAYNTFISQVQTDLGPQYLYVRHFPTEYFLSNINYDNGYDCINTCTLCNGDNRDTVYSVCAIPETIDETDVIVVYGVNHSTNGKAVYTNVSVYNEDKDL
jgi:hypothetical protein